MLFGTAMLRPAVSRHRADSHSLPRKREPSTSATLHAGKVCLMKIALISEHASPLAVAGGVDSGGQNIYVANVARQLARCGHQVDVFTRCDRSLLPLISRFDGVRVINVPAGPPMQLPKEQLLPFMDEFARFTIEFFRRERNALRRGARELLHVGACRLAREGGARHAARHDVSCARPCAAPHQGASDGFPDARFEIEDDLVARSDSVIAECPQDEADLIALYRADPAKHRSRAVRFRQRRVLSDRPRRSARRARLGRRIASSCCNSGAWCRERVSTTSCAALRA